MTVVKLTQVLLFLVVLVYASTTARAQNCPGSSGCSDDSFAFNGKNELSVPAATNTAFSSTQDRVVLSDGRIIVLTGANDNENTFRNALVGFTHDGQIDTTFGTGGFTYITWGTPQPGLAHGLAIQNVNGVDRLVIVGGFGGCGANCIRVEAYTTSGTADPTFGSGGSTMFNFSSTADLASVVVQSDQTILISGGLNPVVKLNVNGTRNTSFAVTSAGVYIRRLRATPDGKFLAAGNVSGPKGDDFAVARFLSNGKLDTAYGKGGKATIDFAKNRDLAIDVAVDSSGRVLACGEAQFGGSTNPAFDAVLVRFTSSGALDATFASGGKARLDIGGAEDEYASLVVQPDGKILTIGEGRYTGNKADVLAARYNTNGSLDPTFNGNGWSLTDFYGAYDSGIRGVLQFDPACGCQKLVVSVYVVSGTTPSAPNSVGLLRYLL